MSQGRGAYSCHNAVIGQSSRCPNMPKHAQTCQSPPDVYSIAVMTKSSSKVVTGQISHDKIYYGQMIKLQKSEKQKSLTLR